MQSVGSLSDEQNQVGIDVLIQDAPVRQDAAGRVHPLAWGLPRRRHDAVTRARASAQVGQPRLLSY